MSLQFEKPKVFMNLLQNLVEIEKFLSDTTSKQYQNFDLVALKCCYILFNGQGGYLMASFGDRNADAISASIFFIFNIISWKYHEGTSIAALRHCHEVCVASQFK